MIFGLGLIHSTKKVTEFEENQNIAWNKSLSFINKSFVWNETISDGKNVSPSVRLNILGVLR